MSQGRVVVVSGPSGAGKTSVMRRVYRACQAPLARSVSATTRPPRNGETDGVDYHFLSDEEFSSRRQRGDFLENLPRFLVLGLNAILLQAHGLGIVGGKDVKNLLAQVFLGAHGVRQGTFIGR